jgi:hypothetical protein
MIDRYKLRARQEEGKLTDDVMRTIAQIRKLGFSKKELSMVVDSVYKVPEFFYRGGNINRKIQ